ncbi:hypothetical protein KIN20_034523 [Parelaphostrongylus tenuis]|uniref:Uncharacterized protein n=1 Tax=Parelaphostrongylus tenuis TaxID=148309 RepID=A0AAD5WJ21_PARTN|nr:hypothetical protein KIN20_034523 [Parelaphostrongylus tenuis]
MGIRKASSNNFWRKFRTVEAQTFALRDQEKLCDSLYSTVIQLKQKGELIYGAIPQQLLLEKFTKNIQRHVIQKRRQIEATWLTEEMLASIKEHIKEELQLQYQMREKVNLRYVVRDTNVGAPPQAHSSQHKIITRKPRFYREKAGH